MTVSPQLRALGPGIRILNALIDALILGAELENMWDHPLVKTAILVESGNRESGWNEDLASRTMKQWGAKDQYGIYATAGLSDKEREVAFLHFDRQLDSREIGRYLNRSAVTVRVQLHKIREKLERLSIWEVAA